MSDFTLYQPKLGAIKKAIYYIVSYHVQYGEYLNILKYP